MASLFEGQGPTSERNNYRGILLADHVSKSFVSRSKDVVDPMYSDRMPSTQFGAVPRRGTDFASHIVQAAAALAEKNGWFLASQFETDANADIHEATTAREILGDFAGERLDYWITGYGTGGTVSGVARVLRKERPDTRIILTEPANAAIVSSGYVNTRNEAHQPTQSHPNFEPHPIQGWTPDFIPWVLQEAIDKSYYDELIPIAGSEGIEWSRRLAAGEGIFTGISGGSTFAVAMRLAEKAPEGAVMLVMLPDTGERYLSTPLFEGIEDDMTLEERAISMSTPSAQMAAD
jgi:cysteine synthase A